MHLKMNFPKVESKCGNFNINFFLSCNVLVSLNPLCLGLPQDTTEEEFIEMMSKYGIIMQDPETSKSDS